MSDLRSSEYRFRLDGPEGEPFAEGDTLMSYAARRLARLGDSGDIAEVHGAIDISEVVMRNAAGSVAQELRTVLGEYVNVTVHYRLARDPEAPTDG